MSFCNQNPLFFATDFSFFLIIVDHPNRILPTSTHPNSHNNHFNHCNHWYSIMDITRNEPQEGEGNLDENDPLFDEEMRHIWRCLRQLGFHVDYEDRPCVNPVTYGPIFHYTFFIGGFGKFAGHSNESCSDAFNTACDKVKAQFRSSTLEQILSEPWPFPLNRCQIMLIDAVNFFNKLKAPEKHYTAIIDEIVAYGKVRLTSHPLSLSNSPAITGVDGKNVHHACIYLANLSILGKGDSESSARISVYRKAYKLLKRLSKLLDTFISLNLPNSDALNTMQQLLASHKESFAIKVKTLPSGALQTEVNVDPLFTYRATTNDRQESENEALTGAHSMLASCASFIRDLPINI